MKSRTNNNKEKVSRLGETIHLSLTLTMDQAKMVETLAKDKYKCPQSKNHAIRMLIEDEYYAWLAKEGLDNAICKSDPLN